MITQGSNLPLYFSNIPVSLDSINDISVFLCTKDGVCLKYWGKDDVTVSEGGIIAPVTQAESMRFPEGRVFAELKFTDSTGTILPGVRVSDHVSKRDDRTPLSGEQPQNLRYVDIDCSDMTADIGAVIGASAYEVAVRNGFEGTEAEWLETLKYTHSEEYEQLTEILKERSKEAESIRKTLDSTIDTAVLENESLGQQIENAKDASTGMAIASETALKAARKADEAAIEAVNTANAAAEETKKRTDKAVEDVSSAISEANAEEAKRSQAESLRAQAETLRASAETQRAENESARKTAETKRTEAEAKRAESENKRSQAETSRAQAESSRTQAESERTEAENARKWAEDLRESAEETRAENDTKRQRDTETALERVDTAIKSLVNQAKPMAFRIDETDGGLNAVIVTV